MARWSGGSSVSRSRTSSSVKDEDSGCSHGDCEIARSETKTVRKLKILVYLVLIISALAVTLGE
jgi:predicted nucleic acid-binding Zn ribbon protein